MGETQVSGISSGLQSTHDRILYTAAECIFQNGYQQTRMIVIAEKAGLSRAALYKYFPTKEAVLRQLNRKAVEIAFVESKNLTASREPALLVMREYLEKYLNSKQAGFISAILIEDAQQAFMLDSDEIEDVMMTVKKAVSSVIRRGIKEGDMRADIKPIDMAHTILALIHSVQKNTLSSHPLIDLSEARHRGLLVETIISGLRPERN